jgi:PDZ domain-containing protein
MLQEGRPKGSLSVRVLAVAIVTLLVAGVVAWLYKGAQGYFVLSPGSAPIVSANPLCRSTGNGNLSLPNNAPCVRLVLPPDKVHPVTGTVMMVDVLEGPASWNDYLLKKLGLLHVVDSSLQMIPAGNVLGTTPSGQLTCQDNQDMTDSTDFAAVAALRRLGYTVAEDDRGARVYTVIPGSAAQQAGVQCDDLITAIDGTHIHTEENLGAAIREHSPGDVIHITVQRPGQGGAQNTKELTARLTGVPAVGGQPAHPNVPFLGVQSNTATIFVFPFNVQIEVGNIGGPSAGLALTLGLLDSLSSGQLTGGLKVAATGTIDTLGNVGPIGGAAQKAVAVRRAGATVFFVPPANYKDAKSESGSMKVFQVTTLDQALQDLESLGGRVPPPVPSK